MDLSVKVKQRKFVDGTSVGGLFIMDAGYNNFRYVDGMKRYRVIDTCCIHFVFGGSGVLFIDGRRYEISAGQMFVMFKGDNCMYFPSEDDPWRYSWINVGGIEAEKYMTMMGFSADAPVRSMADTDRYEADFTALFSQDVTMSAAYYKAMSIFFSAVAECANGVLGEEYIRGSGVVERAKEIIHLNYDNPDFSVGLLDKIMHISHSYICRLFKEQMNVTAASYLLNYRLSKAAEYAVTRDCQVKELCSKAGFSDELYFMKKFKERYGMTVKDYMRTYGQPRR